jgi:hypothetical protein
MKVACTSIVAVPRFRAAKPTERSEAVVGAPLDALNSSERNAGVRLRQDAVDDVTSDVGKAEVAPLIAVGEPLMINPE